MKRWKFSEAQVAFILRHAAKAAPVDGLPAVSTACGAMGIS